MSELDSFYQYLDAHLGYATPLRYPVIEGITPKTGVFHDRRTTVVHHGSYARPPTNADGNQAKSEWYLAVQCKETDECHLEVLVTKYFENSCWIFELHGTFVGGTIAVMSVNKDPLGATVGLEGRAFQMIPRGQFTEPLVTTVENEYIKPKEQLYLNKIVRFANACHACFLKHIEAQVALDDLPGYFFASDLSTQVSDRLEKLSL